MVFRASGTCAGGVHLAPGKPSKKHYFLKLFLDTHFFIFRSDGFLAPETFSPKTRGGAGAVSGGQVRGER